MASLVGRLAVSVKGTLRPPQLERVCNRLGSLSLSFRNDYSTGVAEEFEEDEIDHIRDVSGLSATNRARARGQLPPNLGERSYHKKQSYRRKLFNDFGQVSGFDPGSMWPSKERMKSMIEDQAEYEMSVPQMLAEIEKENQMKQADNKEREKTIAENMAKMPEMIAEYHKRAKQREELSKKQSAKKARLLAEAQEYFGFSVDPRDEKFKEMVAEKEAAEKKEEKQRKKAEKLAKMTARLGE